MSRYSTGLGVTIVLWATHVQAATIGVTSVGIGGVAELSSFVADGRTYPQSQLIQATLAAFEGNQANSFGEILVPTGDDVPPVDMRSALLAGDYLLDTGIINPAVGASTATLVFAPPLVNGHGPDLVMFEVNGATPPNSFIVQINSTAVAYESDDYGPPVQLVNVDTYRRADGVPIDISQLEGDSYSLAANWSGLRVFGIAIDLDDFNVGSMAAIGMVHFGSNSPDSLDPVLFLGINSVGLHGDYDFDADVDGNDFLKWQRTLSSSANLDADGNGDGKVDAEDLAIWRDGFGSQRALSISMMPADTAAAPEPSAWALVGTALTAGASRFKRSRSVCAFQR